MAYGTRYRHEYCTLDNKRFEILLQEDGFSGGVTQVEAGPTPFTISMENSQELKIGSIMPTKATVTLMSSPTFNLEILYTADENKFRIIHRLVGGGTYGYWEGFVIPNGFSEEMDDDYHYMTIQASDGLASLRNQKFLTEDGKNYGTDDGIYERSFLFVIKECLKKTGLSLPIKTLVDIKTMLSGEASQGGIYPKEVGFYAASGTGMGINALNMWDENLMVANSLSVGMSIKIRGGVNDGRSFTVLSWDSIGTPKRTAIYVAEEPVDTNYIAQNVVLDLMLPPPPGNDYEDPLVFSVHDVRTYVDKTNYKIDTERRWLKQKPYYESVDGTKMAWDVLQSICTLWNVRLFQNNGYWEIRRWNAEALPAGTYQWFIYTSDGEANGRESFGQDVVFYCDPTPAIYMPKGHTKSMDRVLKRVAVKYNYRFKQEGDSLDNLIQDGNFANLNTTDNKWLAINQPVNTPFDSLRVLKETADLPPGFATGLRMFGFAGTRGLTNSMDGYSIDVIKGDRLFLTIWEKIDGTATDLAGVYGITLDSPVLSGRAATRSGEGGNTINENESKVYYLVNNSGMRKVSQRESGEDEYYFTTGAWEEGNYRDADELKNRIRFLTVYGGAGSGRWRKIDIEIDSVPVSGTINVEVVGIATLRPLAIDRTFMMQPTTSNIVKAFVPKEDEQRPRGSNQPIQYNFELEDVRLTSLRSPTPSIIVTGMFMSRVRTESELDTDYIGYLFEQDGKYSDTLEDVDILNASEDNENHVGVVRVQSGGELVFTDKWDSWANDFGWDTLGMVLAKSIVQNYGSPYRKIDGAFVAPNLSFGSRLFIEITGGAKYIILHGSLSFNFNKFTGTIVQIGVGDIPDNSRAPEWQANGVTRCQKSVETGLNTGMVEVQEVDINPRSQTFMQSRWAETQEDTLYCPVGEPDPVYWGAVLDTEDIDIDELSFFPFEKNDDEYTVGYNNDGTGKTLILYYLGALGTLRSVKEVEGEESISSWETIDNVTINGITYKGVRMKYVTGTFSNHPKTFKIN